MRFGGTVNDFLYEKERIGNAKRPRLSEEGGGEAVGRGKCEQKRKNENSVSKTEKY